MKNPYKILGISQDATHQEILAAVAKALKNRIYSAKEVAEARATLSKPASRLSADFTFPIFPERKNIRLIESSLKPDGTTIDSLNPDKYDSL